MTGLVEPGPASSPDDARATRYLLALLRDELPRVRAAAVSWRNGLAGLLAALVGFSLIRGRSDISELARPWNILVGALLLAALLTGAVAALSLLRAAHGRPAMATVTRPRSTELTEHVEAVNAIRALRRGIVLSLACAALLVAAVGTTWYGPAKSPPQLEIATHGTTTCGQIVKLDSGTITIATSTGEVSIELSQIQSIRPLASCP